MNYINFLNQTKKSELSTTLKIANIAFWVIVMVQIIPFLILEGNIFKKVITIIFPPYLTLINVFIGIKIIAACIIVAFQIFKIIRYRKLEKR